MANNRPIALISVMLATLVAIAAAALLVWRSIEPDRRAGAVNGSAGSGGAVTAAVDIGGPFTLIDQDGRQVTDGAFRGRYMLVYFGYAYCPDVCPTELQNMALAVEQLGAAAEDVQPIFITVDPERDTVAFLADYVEHFHPRMVGLTGTPEQTAEAARAYRVFFAKVRDEGASEYLVDHSSFVYLMGPDGEFLTMFRGGTAPAQMAETIRSYIDGRG